MARKKCLICRNEIPWIAWQYFKCIYDTDTGEQYCFCTKCATRLRVGKANPMYAQHGVRQAVVVWLQLGVLTVEDVERIEQDSISVIAQKFFNTSSSPFGIWSLDKYLVVDEMSQRILVDGQYVNFSDIESYKVFDNSIEYNVQSPNSTQYEIDTSHGLRRSIVGGIFAGPTGAIMGGLTAKHSVSVNVGGKSTYNTTVHDFTLLVTLKTFAFGGSIAFKLGSSEVLLQQFINLFDRIILH